MPRRSVPLLLPPLFVLGLLGVWAGAGFSALPVPAPTLSLPTVTVPPLLPQPIPVVTVPPKVDPSPAPPAPASPTAPVESTRPPAPRVARSVDSATDDGVTQRPERRSARSPTAAPPARHGAAAPTVRAHHVKGVPASVQGPLPEDGGFLGPIGAAVRTLDDAAKAIPPALFAMAALAVLLLAVASMPQPLRASRAGATLVHKRGSIALAGGAALAMAIATYLLL